MKYTGIDHTTWEKEAEDHDNWKSLVNEKISDGEEVRRETLKLKHQRRKTYECQHPLTIMFCPYCHNGFEKQRNLYLYLSTSHNNQTDWS